MLQDMEKHADELSDARTAVEAILSNPLLQALFSGQVRGSTLYTDLHMKCVYNYIYIYRMHQIVSLHFIIVIVIRQLPITFGRLPWPSRQVMMSYGWLAKSLPGPCPVTSKLLSRAETCRPNQRRRQRPLQNLVQMAQCR